MKNAQLRIYTKERNHLNQLQTPQKLKTKINKERPLSSLQNPTKTSPTSQSGIGLRKLNLNVNVNLNNNDTSLPHIGPVSPLTMQTDVNGNISHNTSTNNTQKTPNRTRIKDNRRDLTPNYSRDVNTMNIQRLQTEIAQKRADYIRLETEVKQKDKFIQELIKVDKHNTTNNETIPSYQQGVGIKNKELALILSLKRQVKELHKDLKTKDDALEALRKQAKLTKLNEYEVEIKTLNEELLKVKGLCESSPTGNAVNSKEFQFLQDTHSFQQNLINSLQEYNNKLILETKEKDEKISKLKEKNKELEEKLGKVHSNGGTFIPNDNDALNKVKTEYEAKINDLKKEHINFKEELESKENKLKEMEDHYTKASQEVKGFYRTLTTKDKIKIEELIKMLNEKENELSSMKGLLKQKSLKLSNEVEEMTYLLQRCFIARKISYDRLKSIVEEIDSDTENYEISAFIEKVSENILILLKNVNPNNKTTLINYFNSLSILDPKEFKTIKENLQDNFLANMEVIDYTYSEDEFISYTNEIKKHLNQFKSDIVKHSSHYDKNKTGYISYEKLEDIFDTSKYELEKNLIDFLIFKMKSFDDENSYLNDLKYSLVLELLDDEEGKRLSSVLSTVCIPLEEAEQRLEGIFKNIAEYLYNKNTGTRNVFSSTILIEDKNVKYHGMYLAIFLSVLKDEIKLNIDATDSICLFNKLKNVTNIFCIELVDIDILVMELKEYGIKEYVDLDTNNLTPIEEVPNPKNEVPKVNQNFVRQRTSSKYNSIKSITGTYKVIKDSHQLIDETFTKTIESKKVYITQEHKNQILEITDESTNIKQDATDKPNDSVFEQMTSNNQIESNAENLSEKHRSTDNDNNINCNIPSDLNHENDTTEIKKKENLSQNESSLKNNENMEKKTQKKKKENQEDDQKDQCEEEENEEDIEKEEQEKQEEKGHEKEMVIINESKEDKGKEMDNDNEDNFENEQNLPKEEDTNHNNDEEKELDNIKENKLDKRNSSENFVGMDSNHQTNNELNLKEEDEFNQHNPKEGNSNEGNNPNKEENSIHGEEKANEESELDQKTNGVEKQENVQGTESENIQESNRQNEEKQENGVNSYNSHEEDKGGNNLFEYNYNHHGDGNNNNEAKDD